MPVASIYSKMRSSQVWVPWFVLFVGLAVTIFSAWYVAHSSAAREQARFAGLSNAAVEQLDTALDDYTAVLRDASGLFAAMKTVSADQFDAGISALDIPHRYPALRGVGYASRVRKNQLPEFVALAREQVNPKYEVHPPDIGDEAYPNFFASPRDGKPRPGQGFNVLSNPIRTEALFRARDTALPASTSRLHLLSQTDNDPVGAFLIFFPIYDSAKPPETLEERREKISGAVFVGFKADQFFEHSFDSEIRDRMQIFVYDQPGSDKSGTATAATELLFDPLRNKPEHAGYTPHLSATRNVEFAGRTWTLQMAEREDFDQESGEPLPPFILLGGFGISLVLFAVTRGQALAQQAAEASAVALTASSEALKASQARIRRLVDSNLIGVFFCSVDGRISEGNDEFLRLIGHSRSSDSPSVDVRFDQLVASDHLADQRQSLKLLENSGVCPPHETSFIRPDGTVVPALIGLAMVDGSRTDAVAFTIDLTDRKRAERELKKAKEAAETANRSKDQFLAVLSHELRTPLTPVLAMTTAARDNPNLSAEARSEMAMIHRNIELEAKLIDDLLDLTRIGRGKLQLHLETVDVHQVIKDAIEVSSSAEMAAKQLVIEQDLAARLHHVRGDPARLQQIFWNLVKNAVKFTPGGGRIRVRTFDTAPAEAGPSSFGVEISDTGLGIEADLLPKIFDAFEQGSIARAQASGGLGLGLAISRGLVEAHGGKISATSAGHGKGATFTVRLPVTAVELAAATSGSATPIAPQKVPLRILLVEDHIDTANILARLLRMGGNKVQVGNCVADADRLCSENEFDLLVSDLGLPDGSGIDVIHSFHQKQNGRATYAIALTGYGAEMDVARTSSAGFDEHLTKPISFQNLQQAIERVVSEKPSDHSSNHTEAAPSA